MRFYRDVLGMELLYGGEGTGFSSLRTRDAQSAILNLERGEAVTGWGRLIFYVSDVDALWNHLKDRGFDPKIPQDALVGRTLFPWARSERPRAVVCPAAPMTCEEVRAQKKNSLRHGYSSGGGQAASLKVGSTVILHSLSSHSGALGLTPLGD